MTTVVHCQRAPFDVYCGRPSKWGNPFPIAGSSRADAIRQFAAWFYAPEQAPLRADAVAELTDKVLGCWCKPKDCHCDVIAVFVNSYDPTQETWNTCPDCGRRWKDLVATPGLLHRTRRCPPCYDAPALESS